MSSNDEKIALYMTASEATQLDWEMEEQRLAAVWLNDPIYTTALSHLHAVPPLKPINDSRPLGTGGTQTLASHTGFDSRVPCTRSLPGLDFSMAYHMGALADSHWYPIDNSRISSLITPAAFINVLGQGVSGTVVSSANGSDVVKVFSDKGLARHEVNILPRACGLAVPVARGVVSDGDETGVVMTYEGSPIRDLGRATTEQRRQLAAVLRSLHGRGIHHHDVREANVLVDDRGHVTLVDFHQAELNAHCLNCSDTAMLRSLQAH
ncbi:hypothetical protein DFH09DRAFT_1106911 [Mycena vulgaris]|nr:hypothetical protein DFH09DRAFT_1106911 [Mycena vulgaris]